MKILLDTHIVCWHYYEPRRLPDKARQIMVAAEMIFLSSASIWEIAIKARLGKIHANPQRVYERIVASGFYELPVYARHAVKVADLPLHHSDPFDRILIAQAMSEPLHLLTADPQLKQYSDLVILV